MKFAFAVVLLAVALGVETVVAFAPIAATGTWDGRSWNSAWDNGLAGWGVRSALNDGQWHEGVWGDRSGWAGNGAWAGEGAWGVPAVIAARAVSVAPVGATIVSAVPAVVPVAHERSYVAKTRGAVHVAPLSGHANSAASINLAPAPGTV